LRFCLSVFVRGAPISGVSIGPIRGAPVGPFRGSPMGLFQRPHLDKLFLVSATGSTNATACMYIAGFTGTKVGPCAACPAGKYKTATGKYLSSAQTADVANIMTLWLLIFPRYATIAPCSQTRPPPAGFANNFFLGWYACVKHDWCNRALDTLCF